MPLGALLSGGIDSSLVSSAAQRALTRRLLTFNVRAIDPAYDETWAAQEVARAIGSEHETLEMSDGLGGWDDVTALLRHVGQPFADTSLFAVREVSRVMRRHVTVALSGDGGDEGFGGYDQYWQLRPINLLRSAPLLVLGSAPLPQARPRGWGWCGGPSPRIRALERADDITACRRSSRGSARRSSALCSRTRPPSSPRGGSSSRAGRTCRRRRPASSVSQPEPSR